MDRSILGAFLALTVMAPVQAADLLSSASERFAAGGKDVPSFQRHVVPLLGRMGCNGRACHGSFQGQGGFRLSLFGYDFQADHEGLLGGEHPRVDLKAPQSSLMLRKPTQAVPHGGGKRMGPHGWEYRLLLRWIQAGAPGVRPAEPPLGRPLMEWMRPKENPYFARPFVNRVGASYFHAGIIDPPDDMNLANPPSNPALLEYLSREFVACGYDMKWLHREIANSLFGKPSRALNCDCERSNEPSLLQSVYLRNDQEVLRLLDRDDGWLKQIARAKAPDAAALIRVAYLRTTSRLPDAREMQVARKYLAEAGDTVAGLRDLMWVLLNTKEFILNR